MLCELRKWFGDGRIKETMTKKRSHQSLWWNYGAFYIYLIWRRAYWRYFLGFLFFIFRIVYSNGFAVDSKWHKYYLIACEIKDIRYLFFSGKGAPALSAHIAYTHTTQSILLPHDDNSWLNWSILLPIPTIHYFSTMIFMFSFNTNDSKLHLISTKSRRITAKEDLHNIYIHST